MEKQIAPSFPRTLSRINRTEKNYFSELMKYIVYFIYLLCTGV